MKKIAILGSTGSIGTQALNIIENNEEDYEAVVLSCAKKVDILYEQIEKFHPKAVCVANEKDAIKVQNKYKNIEVDNQLKQKEKAFLSELIELINKENTPVVEGNWYV